MAHKILIVLTMIVAIALSGCSESGRSNNNFSDPSNNLPDPSEEDGTKDALESDLSTTTQTYTPKPRPTIPVVSGRKTLITDEKTQASIYYDKGFYFKIDDQEYKLADDRPDAYYMIADEPEFPQAVFHLYAIEKDDQYFVVDLHTPTNGVGSTDESWYFLYNNKTLKLIEHLKSYDLQDKYPEIEFEPAGEKMIRFKVPGLDKEYKIETGNEDYIKHGEYKFVFLPILALSVEKDYVILECLLSTAGRREEFAKVLLYFNIDENGIELFDLKD